MSISFWVIAGLILLFCGYLFTKTVSDDAKNDFRLRDILSNASSHSQKMDDTTGECEELVYTTVKPVTNEYYEEKPESKSFSTNAHEGAILMNVEKNGSSNYKEKSYYQKDRYMVTDKVDSEQKMLPDKSDETAVKNSVYDKEYANMNIRKEHIPVIHKKGVIHYIKVFWKGVTFALGVPAMCYGLFSFVTNAPTITEKLTYSIWILLGVILIK